MISFDQRRAPHVDNTLKLFSVQPYQYQTGETRRRSTYRLPRRGYIGTGDVHGVTFRKDAPTPDIDQDPALLRREPCGRYRVVDVICTLRSCVD